MKKILFFLLIGIFCFAIDKSVSVDLSELNFEVLKAYKNEYQGINIKNLSLEQASSAQAKQLKLLRVELSQNALKQSYGMFSAIYSDESNREVRIYFRFKIFADVEVVKATRDIIRDKKIESGDIEVGLAAFERNVCRSVSRDGVVGMSARRFIKAGNTITKDDVSQPFLVNRNSTVVVAIREGELEVEFEATAMEDGAMGQLINVKNKNGKVYKAEVVGLSSVSIK